MVSTTVNGSALPLLLGHRRAQESDVLRLGKIRREFRARAKRIPAETILIHLQPQVTQLFGRVVVIGDGLTTREFARDRIERHRDVMIDLLLPIARTRRTRRSAHRTRSGQCFIELAKPIAFEQQRNWRFYRRFRAIDREIRWRIDAAKADEHDDRSRRMNHRGTVRELRAHARVSLCGERAVRVMDQSRRA